MWLFVAADGVFFLAMLAAYGRLRAPAGPWPRPLPWWPGGVLAVLMTACLLAGSAAFFMAARVRTRTAAGPWIAVAAVSGVIFDALELKLWIVMRSEGVHLVRNPWGTPLFGAFLFVLTGWSFIHVSIGILYSSVVARGVLRQRTNTEEIETAALYWYFVSATWLALFVLLVLPSIRPLSSRAGVYIPCTLWEETK